MPTQTSITSYIWFPDGAKVSVMASGEVSYTDLGAIEQGVTATVNYDESQIETGNAGKLAKRIKNMTVAGAFNLINLDPANIVRIGGGMFTSATTAASATTDIPDQVIAANWDDNIKYEIIAYTSSSDSTKLKLSAKPTLTSVKLGDAGTEVLLEIGAAAAGDYMVVADSNSYSGWSIMFNSAGMSAASPKTFAITIDFGSNTPVAKTTLWCGNSSVTFSSYKLRFTHTDDFGLTRVLELFAVDTNSGGMSIDFGGANEEGVEEIPFSFTGKCDSTLSGGTQLFSFSVDTGAA